VGVGLGGWERSATIVREPAGAPSVTLVPWQAEGISRARRTPDGRTVVFVLGAEARWHAVRIDRPGELVDVTGSADDVIVTGLTDDRLIGWEPGRMRYVSWRLDGRDRGRPVIVLEDVPFSAPFAGDRGRVIGGRADGSVVSAAVDGSQRASPVVVLRTGALRWGATLAYDPVHRRVVTSALVGGAPVIVSAGLLGEDADHPRVLGMPRPPESSDLERLEITAEGDVLLEYTTRYTAVPHPSGWDVLAADGSGFRTLGAPPARLPESARSLTLDASPVPDEADGAETRTPL
jgi:hypothetical protein